MWHNSVPPLGFGETGSMDGSDAREVTLLLRAWRDGDRGALDRLTPIVFEELRRIAGRFMRSERKDHTLQTTALVNEAYLRLVDAEVGWTDRVHFFALAANMMRRILVDHAKAHRRVKRGGGAVKLSLDEALHVASRPSDDLVGLDEALSRLAEFDERKSRVVELLFFGGLTYDETAEALGISPATVHRELRFAKAWLYREVRGDDAP